MDLLPVVATGPVPDETPQDPEAEYSTQVSASEMAEIMAYFDPPGPTGQAEEANAGEIGSESSANGGTSEIGEYRN